MRNRKLRFVALLLVIAMAALALSACGKSTSSSSDTGTKGTEKADSEATGTTPAAGDDTTADDGNGDKANLADMTALEVSKLMGNGINLGNTMESGDRKKLGTDAAIKLYETNWGQPVTTEDMVKGMKAAGFDTLRIPVAWTCAINYEDGDYTIRKEFMDRIDEIVNYALNADMFVVVNDHWDGQWWGRFGDEDESVREGAMTLYTEMWKQIAEHFADYDERLIFESANEELGNRLNDNWKDTSASQQSGVLTKDECYETVNKINQTFVDTVRAAGGNNDHRFLLIAGYDTNIASTCDDRYKMPTDTAKSKLLVSVHYYDPSGYCLDNGSGSWGMKTQYQDMNTTLKSMTKFTEAGYGVIIGEWGVLHGEAEIAAGLREGTLLYMENFLDNCDLYGYVPLLWDTNGAYGKDICAMRDADMAKIFTNHSYAVIGEYDENEYLTKVGKDIAAAEEAAPEYVVEDGTAWIMYNASDWGTMYSVGDKHPAEMTEGVVAEEPIVTEAGTYTVSLDFTGTSAGFANSTAFAAVGIYKGEELNPDYVINIKEILVNGQPYELKGTPYTASDDDFTTRVNLYNGWIPYDESTGYISSVPDNARADSGVKLEECSAVVVDPATLGEKIESISVTFDYGPAK
ncbi:MAG: glycoside hydrolase family 5 protein [Butyrivibrio sp.]|nr:glycoside hydrolase family 5 protein [Butyrivibrio sp.]